MCVRYCYRCLRRCCQLCDHVKELQLHPYQLDRSTCSFKYTHFPFWLIFLQLLLLLSVNPLSPIDADIIDSWCAHYNYIYICFILSASISFYGLSMSFCRSETQSLALFLSWHVCVCLCMWERVCVLLWLTNFNRRIGFAYSLCCDSTVFELVSFNISMWTTRFHASTLMSLLWQSISQYNQTVWMISIDLFALRQTVFSLLLRNFGEIFNKNSQFLFTNKFFSSSRSTYRLNVCLFCDVRKMLWKQQKYLHWQTFVYFINKNKNSNGFATACKMSKLIHSGANKS